LHANQTETSFQLIDKITVGGKLTDVVYQFQKKINKIKNIIKKRFLSIRFDTVTFFYKL
jgi:hypothetical protein